MRLTELYEAYAGAVYRQALWMLNDEADADDVVQETFLAAWRGWTQFRHEASARTWLLRIARFQALRMLRKRRPVCALDEIEEWTPDPVQAEALDEVGADAVWQVVTTLPPAQAEALRLTFAAGLSLREVARATGVPEGTVKSRLHYARRAMRLALLPRKQLTAGA